MLTNANISWCRTSRHPYKSFPQIGEAYFRTPFISGNSFLRVFQLRISQQFSKGIAKVQLLAASNKEKESVAISQLSKT